MVTADIVYKHNSAKLAQKDPFDLNSIEILKKKDKVNYYAGIVSTFILKILQAHPGFNEVRYLTGEDYTIGSYFFNGRENPSAEEYYSSKDSEKFKKGDSVVKTDDANIASKVGSLFDILKEIESHDCVDVPVTKPHIEDIYCNIVSDILSFTYVRPSDSLPYFIFEFHHPEERKRVVKRVKRI